MHSRRRILGGLLAATPFAGAVIGASASSSAAAVDELVHWGCAVRFTDTTSGPLVLADAGHTPVGMIATAVTAAGDLEVRFERSLRTIVSAFAQPDEQMVARAITIGPSVGFDRIVLRMAVAGRQCSARDPRLYGRNVNLFVGVIGYAAATA